MTKSNLLDDTWQAEAAELGLKWEDRVPGTFGKETLKPENIPDDIKDVTDNILKEVLICALCKKNYNIVEPELALYRRLNVPIPRLCFNCRYMRQINLRSPRRLWHRQCVCLSAGVLTKEDGYKNNSEHFHGANPCPNEFETSYSPERPEIVYCEQCYNAEIV